MDKTSEERRRSFVDVIALCVAVFSADASQSMVIPIFPLFAQALGASLMMVGILASTSGLSTMLLSIPLGTLSDRVGRRSVIKLGMFCFIAVPLLYTISPTALHLLPVRIIQGVALSSTFSIGFIYISELTTPGLRALAQGFYMTAMGLGFTVGPFLGGLTTSLWGYSACFYLSSSIAAAGFLILLPMRDLGQERSNSMERGQRGPAPGIRTVIRYPEIRAAGIANFINSLMFSAIVTFFPIYGHSIGFDESKVGLSFTVRGLFSTVSRFPTGVMAKRIGALSLMTLGLGISATTLLVLPFLGDLIVVSAVLGVEGIAYGVYLTAGNMYIVKEAPAERRGAALGVYSTFSNVGGFVSPFILGITAQTWSLRGAFQLPVALAVAGMALMLLCVRKGKGLEGK